MCVTHKHKYFAGLLRYQLHQLGIRTARQILFVADGARWIWNRISKLMESLGVAVSKVYWLEQIAEAMLMLRSYNKSGRWNFLKSLSFSLY